MEPSSTHDRTHRTKALGKKIRALRKAQKWSQRKTADLLGLSQQGYASYESGSIVEIPYHQLCKIAALFQIAIPDLSQFYTIDPAIPACAVQDALVLATAEEA